MSDFEKNKLSGDAKIFKPFSIIEPLTDEEKNKHEEWKLRDERMKNIFIEYENDFSKLVTELLKEDGYASLLNATFADAIFAIENIENPQRTVDKFSKEERRKNSVSTKNKNSPDARQKTYSYTTALYFRLDTLADIINTFSNAIDRCVHYNAPETPERRWKKALNKIRITQPGSIDNKETIPHYPEGDKLRGLSKELKKSAETIYDTCPLPYDQDPEATRRNFFNKHRIEKYLVKLSNSQERYEYLLHIEAIYLDILDKNPNHSSGIKIPHLTFPVWLKKKISIHEKTFRSSSNPVIPEKAAEEKTESRRGKGGSHYQNLLAIHYLFEYLKVKNNKKARSRFASFLTGFSQNTLYNDSLNIHNKQDIDGVEWEKDMEIVRDFFEDIGLAEITRMIENDLES